MSAAQPRPVLRESRRTSTVVIGPDTVRLCDPECRNEVLLDLHVPHGRSAWVYRGSGSADVHVAWSGKDYHVTWRRNRASALPCDQCGDEWMYRIPDVVAAARRASEAQKGVVPPEFVPFIKKSGPGGP